MSEENKALYRSFVEEIINKYKINEMGKFIAEDFVDLTPPPGIDLEPGLAGMQKMMGMFLSAFPDLHSTIDDLVAEGDKVVGLMTTTGTHKGDFMGIPATGKQINFKEIHTVRIVNGKAIEHWGIAEDLKMMQQLGVVPSQ